MDTRDLERKLGHFLDYYNEVRIHQSLGGITPERRSGLATKRPIILADYRCQVHFRGLCQLPAAA
jgi:hypothetical protein